MCNMYDTILSPIDYGGLQLKNRIIFAPTTFGLSDEEYLAEMDYCYEAADLNTKKWFILLLIIWEAGMMSEQKMNTKLTFPLLQNCSN
mgnify:CR=1 FL=1